MENIKVDPSYFMVEVNHVDKCPFDMNLATIAPYSPADFPYMPFDKAFYSLNLHPTHGFSCDIEIMREVDKVEWVPGLRPTG